MQQRKLSMISKFLILFFLSLASSCSGQNNAANEKTVYDIDEVDSAPAFPGDDEALNRYLNENVKWVADFDVHGKVYVSFIVNNDGSILDIKVEKGLCDKCDEESVRVVKTFPRWKPGKVNGINVSTRVMINIPFKLTN